MAILHLQFDVDSEVHPELHAMLSSIGSSLSQAERLRQLAATGLVWERLRLQAYGRMEVPDLGVEAASAREGGASLPDPPVAAAPRAVPRVDATTARTADLAGFVDLSDTVDLTHLDIPRPDDGDDGRRSGHDAASPDVASAENMDRAVQIAAALLQPRGDVQELLPLHEIRSAVQELPVLTEVIGAAELPEMSAIVATADEALPVATHVGGSTHSSGAQIHELAPARRTATRSRLLRMKEKGLFRNE